MEDKNIMFVIFIETHSSSNFSIALIIKKTSQEHTQIFSMINSVGFFLMNRIYIFFITCSLYYDPEHLENCPKPFTKQTCCLFGVDRVNEECECDC